ncbi:hypothetical protein KBA84_02380 [Patescibacteria group bacterium]|nr:hypothetical protein [Patescibacteria group bacterium]
MQEILGNSELSAITTTTSLDPEQFQKALDMTEFSVNLTPGILYNRIE